MSNQADHENQQVETLTPEEVRQYLLAELEASQQVLAELSDEELTQIVGAGLCCSKPRVVESVHASNWPYPKHTGSASAPTSPTASGGGPTSASLRRTNSAPADPTKPETYNQLLRNNSWDWKPEWEPWKGW